MGDKLDHVIPNKDFFWKGRETRVGVIDVCFQQMAPMFVAQVRINPRLARSMSALGRLRLPKIEEIPVCGRRSSRLLRRGRAGEVGHGA